MNENKSRSMFLAVLLIGIGVLWLLGNLGLLPVFQIGVLLRLWPVILIVIGLNVILNNRAPLLRTILNWIAVVGVVGFTFLAPALGLIPVPEIQQAQLNETIGEATSAQITLESSVGQTTVAGLVDSKSLIDIDLSYLGNLNFEVSGTTEKVIRLGVQDERVNFDYMDFIDENDLFWKIGLTPEIPLALEMSGGVGEVLLDLAGINLTDLRIRGGVGDFVLNLPGGNGFYIAQISAGVGDFSITIEENADIQLVLDGGVGSFAIDVPADAAVRVDGTTSVGDITVPSHFQLLQSDQRTVGESGVWETTGFDEAENQILITLDGGVGDFRIR